MAGNETTVKPSLDYLADAISPNIQGAILNGTVDVACMESAIELYTLGQTRLWYNKQSKKSQGLKTAEVYFCYATVGGVCKVEASLSHPADSAACIVGCYDGEKGTLLFGYLFRNNAGVTAHTPLTKARL